MSSPTGFAAAPVAADEAAVSRSNHDRQSARRVVSNIIEPEDIPRTAGAQREGAEITAIQRMAAACSGSLLTSLLVTPLDVVRVRLQSQQQPAAPTPPLSSRPFCNPPNHWIPLSRLKPNSPPAATASELGITACRRDIFVGPNGSSPSACIVSPTTQLKHLSDACMVEQTSNRRFQGTWEGLVKIARHEGLSSLWRGLSPTLVMTVPANVIYFTGYDSLRYSQYSPFSPLSATWAPLLAGSTARAIAATVISPLELFRTRMQASSGTSVFRSTMQGVREMVAQDGTRSLWRGLGLTLWRDVPFSGLYWLGYEVIKDALRARREHAWHHNHQHPAGILPSLDDAATRDELHAENTFTDAFLAGSLSGAVAAFLTQPFDVGKTRRQVSAAVREPGAGREAETMTHIFGRIWREEGLRGLWTGWGPRVLKVAPACAIMISSYEVGKKAAKQMNVLKEAV